MLVIQLPRLVNDARNGEGIAWEARAGERVVFAEAGVAVTSSDEGGTLTGRDIDSGGGKWRIEFASEGFAGAELFVRRVGRTLVVVDRAASCAGSTSGRRAALGRSAHRGLRAPGGRRRRVASRATHCGEGGRCTVEVRSLRDGSVRWKAPVDSGSPLAGLAADRAGSRLRPLDLAGERRHRPRAAGGARYELRELATGDGARPRHRGPTTPSA